MDRWLQIQLRNLVVDHWMKILAVDLQQGLDHGCRSLLLQIKWLRKKKILQIVVRWNLIWQCEGAMRQCYALDVFHYWKRDTWI